MNIQDELGRVIELVESMPSGKRRDEAIFRLQAVREYLDHPMAAIFLQNRAFEQRQRDARQQIRHRAWLKDNEITDETAARRSAAAARHSAPAGHRLTAAEVIAALGLNQTDQPAQTRVARILRAMGWRRHRTGKGVARRYVWHPELRPDVVTETGEPRDGNGRVQRIGTPETIPPAGRNSGDRKDAA